MKVLQRILCLSRLLAEFGEVIKVLIEKRLRKYLFISLASLLLTLVLSLTYIPLLAAQERIPQVLPSEFVQIDEASIEFEQGQAHLRMNQLHEALASFQRALEIYQKTSNRYGEAKSLSLIGLILIRLGENEQAFNYLERSVAIAQIVDDLDVQLNALEQLFGLFVIQNRYSIALEFLQDLLSISQTRNLSDWEAYSLWNFGYIYALLGQSQRALESYNRSLLIYKNTHNKSGIAVSLAGLAEAYFLLGRYQEAIDTSRQSIYLSEEISDWQIRLKAGLVLGEIYISLGRASDASREYHMALTLSQNLNDRNSEADALLGIGRYWASLDASAFASIRSIGRNPGLDQLDRAKLYYESSLDVYDEVKNLNGKTQVLQELGNISLDLKEYNRAIYFYKKSLLISEEIDNFYEQANASIGLARIYMEQNDHNNAFGFYTQALEIYKSIENRNGIIKALEGLGIIQVKLGKLQEAKKDFYAALDIIESIYSQLQDNQSRTQDLDLSRIGFYQDWRSGIYKNLQRTLVALNESDAALVVSELSRGRALFSASSERSIQNRYDHNSQELLLQEIQQIAQSQNATIVEYSIVTDYESKLSDRAKVQRELLYIWVVSPLGEISFQTVDLASQWEGEISSIEAIVSSVRSSLNVRGLETSQPSISQTTAHIRHRGFVPVDSTYNFSQIQLLQTLNRCLISPIVNLLPNSVDDRIIFIPQEELFLVPFPALMDSDGNYLVEKHTISTAPSIRTLKITRSHKERLVEAGLRELGNNLVVGNPTLASIEDFSSEIEPLPYGSPGNQNPWGLGTLSIAERLPELPDAEQEARRIASLLNTQPVVRDAATESNILTKIENADIIHFATHGIMGYTNESSININSAIALSPDLLPPLQPGEQRDPWAEPWATNGMLTNNEIFNLKLNASFAALSACDTGRGFITEDGVIGLSRSFIVAGVPSVLVSLWQVPDSSTANLMIEFYSLWKDATTPMNKAQALRHAMISTMQDYPEPINWAAFTIVGEAE